jgi:hypothetical protein
MVRAQPTTSHHSAFDARDTNFFSDLKETKTFFFKKSVSIVFIVYRQGLEFVAVGRVATLLVYQVPKPHQTIKLLVGSDLDRE